MVTYKVKTSKRPDYTTVLPWEKKGEKNAILNVHIFHKTHCMLKSTVM